jgi:predicted MFS family arabinose efflux permease
MAAPIIAVAIATAWGWRTTFWVVGAAGIAFMLLAMMARRSVDIGRPRAEAQQLDDGNNDSYQVSGFATLSAIGFLDSATRGASLAFIPFVMTAKGMSASEISWMLTLLFAGGAFGKFVCGWLSDRYGPMRLIWGTKGLTAALLVLSLATPPLAMAPLMVVLGIGLNGTSSVLYATVAELVPARRRARLYGFYYTTNEGGSVAAPLFYGVVADLFSLSAAIATMGVATAAILPASLTLRKYLASKGS